MTLFVALIVIGVSLPLIALWAALPAILVLDMHRRGDQMVFFAHVIGFFVSTLVATIGCAMTLDATLAWLLAIGAYGCCVGVGLVRRTQQGEA